MTTGEIIHGILDNNADQFADTTAFYIWVVANWPIVILFFELADKTRNAGFSRYSAHAIIQVLRWHTDIQSKGDEPLQISNNWFPDLARLYNFWSPERAGFFRTNKSKYRNGERDSNFSTE